MKSQNFRSFGIIFSFLLVVFGCHKAGLGGNAEISVHVKHHDKLIPGALVYVKYNEKEFPGTDVAKYDASFECGTVDESKGHTHIKNLKHGYYYFYSVGFDSSISEKVSGGVPFEIKKSERNSEIELDIPVTE